MAGTSILAKLAVQIVANLPGFHKSLNDASKSLKKFESDVKNIAGAVGLGFGVREVLQFGVEVAKVGGEAQAVSAAFNKFNDSIELLNRLKQATKGTVSELDLMKSTVQAANFGIEISKLPDLFKFATLRAQQTGQSIDYLVSSIVLGIGRKSPMILDNLGISLIRLREKLKGVGAESASVAQMTKVVSEIMNEDLGKMAGFAENAKTSLDRLGASWTNIKAAVGKSGFFDRIFSDFELFTSSLSGDPVVKAFNILQADVAFGTARQFDLLYNAQGKVKDRLIELAIENGKFIVSQEEIAARFRISNEDAKRYWDALQKINQEYVKIKASQDAAAIGEVDPISGMASGGTPWTGRPKVEKTEEQIESEKKALEELLKARESAFKRYAISFSKVSKASVEDLQRYDKQSADLLKTQINNYKALGDSTTKFGEQFGTTMDDAQQVIQSIVASGISLPDLIGRPEDIDYVINKFKELGKGVIETAGDISEAFRSAAEGGLNEFFMGFEQMAVKQITFGQNIINAISSFMRSFGQQLIALGTAKLGLDKLLASLTIPNAAVAIGAIAAGTALVAAAGAMKANNDLAIQKTVRTTSSGTGLRSMESANIQVTGTLVGSGRDLVAVINQTKYDNQIRRGG